MTASAVSVDVRMPELSEGMESGTIIAWLVEDGAKVAVGDELLEVETDKAGLDVDAGSRWGRPERCSPGGSHVSPLTTRESGSERLIRPSGVAGGW